MKRLSVILFGTVLMAVMAVAQGAPSTPPPPGGGMGMRRSGMMGHGGMGAWWKNSQLAQQLKLTDQQTKELEQTFTDYRLKLIDLRAEVERQEAKLQPLMDADQIDAAKVSTELDSLVAARGRLEKANMMMHVDMRKVLTPDQWKQLQSMRQERMQQMRERRDSRRDGQRPRRMMPGAGQAPAAQPTPPPAPPGF